MTRSSRRGDERLGVVLFFVCAIFHTIAVPWNSVQIVALLDTGSLQERLGVRELREKWEHLTAGVEWVYPEKRCGRHCAPGGVPAPSAGQLPNSSAPFPPMGQPSRHPHQLTSFQAEARMTALSYRTAQLQA